MKEMKIERLAPGDEIPYELIYLADEHPEAIADYLKRGDCYVAVLDGKIVGEYVLMPTRPLTAELVNVAVVPEWQGQGIGKRLVTDAIGRAREKGFYHIEVCTGNAGIGQMALYQKCGFTMTGVDVDYFSKNYPEPIYENGIECRHMVRMRLYL